MTIKGKAFIGISHIGNDKLISIELGSKQPTFIDMYGKRASQLETNPRSNITIIIQNLLSCKSKKL